MKNPKEIAKEYNKIHRDDQWNWIIRNKEKVNGFKLDNDATHIIFSGDDMDDSHYSEYVYSFIGNSDGAFEILIALDFNVECV